MDQYPRTRLGALLTLAIFFLVASVSASAQARNTGTSSASAVLHIRINIVPVLIAPPPPREPYRPLAFAAVNYNVPVQQSNIEVTEQTRPLFIGNANQAEGFKGAVLKTLTVVPR